VLPQSRYAALLVSMHGTALYEMRDLDRMAPTDAQAVRAYLDGQRALQAKLAAGLEGEDPARIKRNQRLIWTWDFLSLALCLRWQGRSLDGVPTADANGATVTVHEDTLDPWPFTQDAVTLHTEGRRLAGRFDDEDAMRAALADAPWVTLRFDLSRGAAGG
jgi:hypothetical protein